MLVIVGITSSVGCSDCDETDPTSKCYIKPSSNTEHRGAITADETWSADKIHYIDGRCWVENHATLTIEAGAIIKGRTGTEANASALIIARGAKIMAQGTADKPIVFTSELDNIGLGEKTGTNLTETDREKWGGLIVLGSARISAEDGDDEAQIEGIPATESYGKYGGTNDEDNSGELTYISIRHGGALIGEGNEINGLTLGGVGSGTTIHHVEVVGNLDDGIECFGGTVNMQHALVAFQGDDAIDLDMNYAGTIDNFVVIHGGSTDEGLEIDGPEGITHRNGKFTLKNGTIKSVDGAGSAADIKSKAQGTISNCLFIGYTKNLKVRASFSDTTNCVAKTDAHSNLTDGSGKLVIANNDFTSGTTIGIATGYTKSCINCGCVDEAALDDAITAGNNAINVSSTRGANSTVFDNWTWSSLNNKY